MRKREKAGVSENTDEKLHSGPMCGFRASNFILSFADDVVRRYRPLTRVIDFPVEYRNYLTQCLRHKFSVREVRLHNVPKMDLSVSNTSFIIESRGRVFQVTRASSHDSDFLRAKPKTTVT